MRPDCPEDARTSGRCTESDGPPKSAGEGAARGFAKKMGTAIDQLVSETTEKGEYWAFERAIEGRNTSDVLG